MYSLQNTNYFFWLVVVINNSIPPWLPMKNEHLMLALVPGRRQVKNMDVYLQPLINEFKQLWEEMYTMYQDPYRWTDLLHYMAYVHTPCMIIRD